MRSYFEVLLYNDNNIKNAQPIVHYEDNLYNIYNDLTIFQEGKNNEEQHSHFYRTSTG